VTKKNKRTVTYKAILSFKEPRNPSSERVVNCTVTNFKYFEPDRPTTKREIALEVELLGYISPCQISF
jgi:hypothetical protein